MNTLAKYWKVILALVLVLVAAFFYLDKYKPEKAKYESEVNQLEMMILTMENSIRENEQYANVQDQLDDAKAELDASRQELYEAFPVEMKEEDQIMYVLYLETLFKEEIFFSFNQAAIRTPLRDGAALEVLELVVNYKTTYQGFQDMVDYLATDSRVASVQEATIEYDAETDTVSGTVTLWLYLMDSEMLEYMRPDVATPDELGKENIFVDAGASTAATTEGKGNIYNDAGMSTVQTTESKNNQSSMVWIPKSGSKYHSNASCSGMENPTQVSLDEAVNREFTACSKCY